MASPRLVPAIALLLFPVGCGGGAALMHPAHTLPVNTVTFGAGVSGHFVAGGARDDIDAATEADVQPGQQIPSQQSPDYLQGAAAQMLYRPGVAPWVGARVGLGMNLEAGATYTGQTVRVDARHAFEGEHVALSLGLGASGRLLRPGSYEAGGTVETTGEIPGLADDNVTGWGVDVPVIVGWQSQPRLVAVWGGVRGGYEKLWGNLAWLDVADVAQEAELSGQRLHVGGLLGFAVGLDPIWAGIEIGAAYQSGDAELTWDAGVGEQRFDGNVRGITVTPSGVIGARF